MRLALASASPRRAELLRAAGIDFDVFIANLDESVRPGEAAPEHVARLAEEKARRVLPQARPRAVLGADTVVVVDERILGKPADAHDAGQMLRMLSGRSHQVMTGVSLVCGVRLADSRPGPGALGSDAHQVDVQSIAHTEVSVTTVELARLSEAEISAYVATGEPLDKAGSYAIQGLASKFVTRITGSYSNVVGLPVALVYDLCKRAGLLVS